MLVALNHAACGSWNDKVYIFGGRTVSSNSPAPGVDLVQIYNAKRDRWSYGNPMPFPRSGMGHAPLFEGHLWVIGGETSNGAVDKFKTNDNVFTQVYGFNLKTGRWRQAADMPIGLHGMFPVADERRNRIIVAGGGKKQGKSYSNKVLVLQH